MFIVIKLIYIYMITINSYYSYQLNTLKNNKYINKIIRYSNNKQIDNYIIKSSYLLPTPSPNSIGNFFDNTSSNSMSFIQCYMLAVADITIDNKRINQTNNNQYGIGFPMDIPVMLTYFKNNELLPVKNDFIDYDHLINHVTTQLDYNNIQLYKTPIVLTLQGEFEDDNVNNIYPYYNDNNNDEFDKEIDNEVDDNEIEYTIEELLSMDDDEDIDDEDDINENEDDEDDDYDEDDDDEEDEGYDEDDDDDLTAFLNESPSGKLSNKYKQIPDYTLYKSNSNETTELNNIPSDAIVTEEDSRNLRRAHKQADRVISYANDIQLLASFNYKKTNYHLVKLLEPIFIIGKRINDIKGYYFTLLDDNESQQITPIIENLLLDKSKQPIESQPRSRGPDKRNRSTSSNNQIDLDRSIDSLLDSSTHSSADRSVDRSADGLKKSRRRWTNRISKSKTND